MNKETSLSCITECVMPGLGQFAVGDEITDPILIEKLKDHPYFSHERRTTDSPTPRKEK